MKIVPLLLLLLVCPAVFAADPAPAQKPPTKPASVKTANATSVDGRSASGPVVKPTSSQQDRMRECNKSATGKKGAERKGFMKTCLSTHKG